MKTRFLKLASMVCLAAAMSTAAVPVMAATGPDDIEIKDEINVSITAENAVYDLHKTTANGSRVALCGTVYEQLVTFNGEGEPVPELCESYEMSDDDSRRCCSIPEQMD